MASHLEAVTGPPARTSAASSAATGSAAASKPSGNNVAVGGQRLPPEPPPAETVSVEEIVRRLNELMAERQRALSFHVDEVSGRTVITVRHAATDQVVRQIPSEEVLAVARLFEQAGLLVDALI